MIMKKILTFIIFILYVWPLMAQSPAKYWVEFTDKKNSAYSVSQPEKFLSPRAIENRARYNIAINEQDLPVNQHYIDMVKALDDSLIVFTKSKWLNGITVYSQKDSMKEKIQNLSCVKFCERTIAMENPEEPFSGRYTYTPAGSPVIPVTTPFEELQYGKGEEQIRLNNVHWLHRLGYKGEGMVMMIMDGGFHNVDSIRHFDILRKNNRLLGARNFVQPAQSPFRKESHGTMVLSCIASDIPGELVGSAPNVMVYVAKTEDGRSENVIEEDNWVAGIEWADSLGCGVLNSSLGYTRFDDTLQRRNYRSLNGITSRASRAATIAAGKGMIVCNSAGNEGRGGWRYIGSPADARDILAVGAVDKKGKKANFSSFGPTADGRIKPDACAVGFLTDVASPGGRTVRANGTSFASPLLSGMVACLWQAFPNIDNMEVMDAIRKSGNQASHPDDSLGYGITDFLKAYNLLNESQSVKGQQKLDVTFASYVSQGVPADIKIKADQEIPVTITAQLRGTQKPVSKNVKLKAGEQTISVKLPKLAKNEKYGIVDLKVTGNNINRTYVMGLEHKAKIKKDKDKK